MFGRKTAFFVLTLAFGLVACVAGCGPSSEAASPKPERIVESFYEWYLDYTGNAMVDGAYRSSEYLAPEYVQSVEAIIASFDRGGYDPFLCAQDAPADWAVGKAVVVGDTAMVGVRQIWNPETEYEQNREITVTVKEVDGVWKIAHVACVDPDVSEVTSEAIPALTPVQVVESFYQQVLNPLTDDAYRSSEYLTEAYVQKVDAIIASFDKGGYDPFLCAQDVPGRITFDQAVESDDEASVIVRKFWNPGTQFESNTELTVVLQKVSGQWKINDIQCNASDALAPVIELPQAASPEEAVQGFYDWYLDSSAYVEQTGERLSPLVDGLYQSNPYLTDGLVQKVRDVVGAFDKGGFDPFLCAQDVPESLSFEEPVVSGDIARVVIRTSFEGHAFTVALVREAGGWKMSDVLCEVSGVQDAPASFEGWQTFSDQGYAFQLRYPPSWTYEELELRPPEETPDAEKALKRLLVFQPQGWDGVASPLHIQVTQGTAEEFSLLHVPPSATEELTINSNRVVKAVEGLGSGLEITRYVFTSPTDATIRIVLLDYISGFPERLTGNEDVAQLLLQTLSSLKFTN